MAQVHNHLYPYQPIKAGPGGTHTPTRDGKEACRQSTACREQRDMKTMKHPPPRDTDQRKAAPSNPS